MSKPFHYPAVRQILTVLISTFLTLLSVHLYEKTLPSARYKAFTNNNLSTSTNSTHYYTRPIRRTPSCAHGTTRARSFLLVFMSRSGSTAISQTMSLHSAIDHHFEILNPNKITNQTSAYALEVTRSKFKASISAGKMPGMKIRAIHIKRDPVGWAQLAREFETRIIWQYRKNVFKVALGIYARAVFDDRTATGGISIRDYTNEEERCKKMGVGCSFKITEWKKFHDIITERLEQDLDMVRASKILDGGRDCVYEMPYEDYLYYKEETLVDMFAFLGLKVERFDTFKVKATKDSLCDVVENFDDLCNHFYGCPVWQPFLEDMENNCRCISFNFDSGTYCSMYSDRQLQLMLSSSTRLN